MSRTVSEEQPTLEAVKDFVNRGRAAQVEVNSILAEHQKGMRTFDGPAEEDETARVVRLGGQIKRIYDLMRDGKRRTLEDISEATGAPAASVSAQLRNLRKARYGSHVVRREHIGGGLYEYWVESE